MFKKPVDINASGLKMEIDRLFEAMSDPNITKDSEEYKEMTDRMKVLYELRKVDSDIDSSKSVSPDAWLATAANLLGIVIIVGYEQKQVITTKALALITKLKS